MSKSSARRRASSIKLVGEQANLMRSTKQEVLAYGGFGGGKCTRFDTNIRLASGVTKEIQNVEPGDRVYSLDTDTLNIVENPVRELLDTGTKEMYRVQISGLTDVYVSEDHPFYAITEIEREYGSNMWEGSEERRAVPQSFDWVEVTDLEEQDCVAVPEYKRLRGTNELPSLDHYWLLGYLIGDGSLRETSVNFTCADDAVLSTVEETVPDGAHVSSWNSDEIQYSITGDEVRNNPVLEMVREADVQCKSKHKSVPDFVFEGDYRARQQFLNGLFVADGSTANDCLEFDVASEDLRDDVYHLLQSLGIHAMTHGDGNHETTERDFPRFRLKVKRGSELAKCADELDLLHKQTALDDLADNKTKSLRGTNSQYDPDGKDVVFKRIKEIEYVGEMNTYDLEIANTHNFIADGVVLHNTRACLEKVYRLNLKYPGNRALIVRSNFSDVKSSTVQQKLLEEVIPESHYSDDMHNKTEHVIEHYTGLKDDYGRPVTSEIRYEGLDSKGSRSNDGLPRRISGMEFGTIFIDEATETTESDYVQLIGRLRYQGTERAGKRYSVPLRQLIAATNPADRSHYLYDRFWERNDDNRQKYHLKAADNPGVDDQYVQQMKDNYQGVFYERYVEGKWVGTDDVIFENFDRRNYVVGLNRLTDLADGWTRSNFSPLASQITPPDEWSIYRAIDFGYPSPTTCQWWAVSPEQNEQGQQRYVLFRELYQSEMLIDDVADMIKQYSQDLDVETTFADPAQSDNRETLRRKGITSRAANKDVWNGIQETKAKMGGRIDDVPQLLFCEDSLIHRPDEELSDANKPARVIDEFSAYEWKEGSDQPKKTDDHGIDSMRYLIYSLADGSGPSFDDMRDLASRLQGSF